LTNSQEEKTNMELTRGQIVNKRFRNVQTGKTFTVTGFGPKKVSTYIHQTGDLAQTTRDIFDFNLENGFIVRIGE